jgi:HSP20 family molecular chaperone IbpA
MPTFVAAPIPAADVYETPEEYVVELEVPGYEEKELRLQISDHTLSITGVREETMEEKERSYQLRQRLERSFERTFRLPPEIDGDQVSAAFEKGLLTVRAKKLATTKPRTIPIARS